MADHAWRVPSASPTVDQGDIEAVVAVLRSGVLANGPQAGALEEEFASYVGADHVVALASGTAALVLAGQALGLGRGDAVLVSGFTFAASANAFLSLGCDVVPVDVDRRTMNLDARSLAAAIARTPRARAVVVVDLFGSTVGTDAAIALARAHGLDVIEDAAQAHGARIGGAGGPRVGSRADVTTFSLYATKNMASGEGGLATTPHTHLAEALRRLRNHGGTEQYRHEVVGLNHRITEVSAALAQRQLERLDDANRQRKESARRLAEWCLDAWGEDVTVPAEAAGGDERHVFHQFTVQFRNAEVRDLVAAHLRAAGVDARQFYPYTVRELPGVRPDDTPVADSLRDTVLSLPVHPGLDAGQLACMQAAIASCRLPVHLL